MESGKRVVLRLVVIVAISILASFSVANAGSIDEIDTASWLVQEGAQAYFKVFGTWPASWQDVEAAQLVQVELVSLSGNEIDPDDQSLDFAWDIQYVPQTGGNPPQIAQRVSVEDGRVNMYEIFPVKSYTERFGESENPDIRSALLNEDRLKQWAISGMLFRSLTLYLTLFEEYPETYQEFVCTGVTCIDSSSINPLTQESFKGDGSSNDILFFPKADPDTGEIVGIAILATDDEGSMPWRFTY